MKAAKTDVIQCLTSAIRAATYEEAVKGGCSTASTKAPFVTISRQAGAGGKSLGKDLVRRLNEICPNAQPWTVWDQELVEKIASDEHMPKEVVETMEDAHHSWLREFIESLSLSPHPSDLKVYRRVAAGIRTLAGAGRAVLVGRGGVFVTAGMPGGIHVRLVAPVEHRVRRMAERQGISLDQAAVRVREIDSNRQAFYGRYWPNKQMTPENFTVTFNTAAMTDQQMVECLLPLVAGRKTSPTADADPAPPRARAVGVMARTGTVRGGAF